MRWTRFLPLILILVAVAAFSVTPALAGGRGNGKGGNQTATLTVSPHNPFSAWGQEYTVSGSGFEPSSPVSFSVADPGCCLGFRVWSDASGNVSYTAQTGEPGTYKLDAYQWDGHKFVFKASVSFTVQ